MGYGLRLVAATDATNKGVEAVPEHQAFRPPRRSPLSAATLAIGLLLVACTPSAPSAPAPAPAAPKPTEALKPAAAAPTAAPKPTAVPTPAPAQAKPAQEAVKLQLGWLKTGQQAGEFVAAEKGFYTAEAIDIEFITGGPTVSVIPVVVSGTASVGINGSSAPLLTARKEGLPVRVIGATHDKAAQALTCRPDANIKSLTDLKGKKVGASQPQRVNLEALFRLNNLAPEDVEIVTTGADMASLLAGRIDCRTTNVHVEPVSLRLQGIEPDVLLNYDYGLRQQGDMFFVTDETAKNKPDLLARFLRATAKGWEYALDNPDEAAKITVEKYAPDLDLAETVATIKATKPLMVTDRTARSGLLSLEEEAWKQTIGELVRVGILPAGFSTADILDLSIYKKP